VHLLVSEQYIDPIMHGATIKKNGILYLKFHIKPPKHRGNCDLW